MSGHSKWETIKRQKKKEDLKRGKLFSKLSRAISVAVRTGGGPDPETNYKLRVAIDQAKEANMPKENIKRALSRGGGEEGDLEEAAYEGFGPGGIGVIVEVATDNRNRTSQEIKNLFERGGGNLAGPGAVSFNFEPKGVIVIKTKEEKDDMMLDLIDLGVEDLEETEDGVEAYVSPTKTSELKDKIEEKGYKVVSADLVRRPKLNKTVDGEEDAKKVLSFLEDLEDHDDVQKVFADVNIPQEIFKKFTD